MSCVDLASLAAAARRAPRGPSRLSSGADAGPAAPRSGAAGILYMARFGSRSHLSLASDLRVFLKRDSQSVSGSSRRRVWHAKCRSAVALCDRNGARPRRHTVRPTSVHETGQATPDITYNRRWGGWGSNPRPADYEETGPAAVGAGREPSLSVSAGQPGSSRTGRDRPGRGGMGRVFPLCSHPKAGSRLAGLYVARSLAKVRRFLTSPGGTDVNSVVPGGSACHPIPRPI